ncbi:MAG: ATP-dependent DNA ligase [Vulcanimicrobiaceae bacterium]
MINFGHACESIAATSRKIDKVAEVARYLLTLNDADLESAVQFFTGAPFAKRDQAKLSLGAGTIVAAAQNVWGVSDADVSTAYRQHGDLGAAICTFVRPVADLGLFSEPLSPRSLKKLFDEMATVAGKGAGKRRLYLCERILASCKEAIEAKYIVKIMTGDLRIGLREGLIVDGIAKAFGCELRDVRRAAMAAGDIGAVAVAARHNSLSEIAVRYGRPIDFMLATPILYGSAYRELTDGEWSVEDKFDGIRAQAHKHGDVVQLFSRTLNDISHSYPEVVEELRAIPRDFILDGELIAQRDGNVLPFRNLQARLQRKTVTRELLDQIPVVYMCFDVLCVDNEYLLDDPLSRRHVRLESVINAGIHVRVTRSSRVEPDGGSETLNERFDEARARGHEGLVLKRRDSPYHPGRRGKWWLKLKRELSTLDVVVVAVEWGHGKRANVLSDYTFAVRGEAGELLTIGKAYSGLTDAEIAQYTPWFLAHPLSGSRREKGRRSEIPVEPQIVIEVAFDIIQPSTLHESGFSLRFPRIVRLREDKPVKDIDTIATVKKIYSDMLKREGVPQ